MKATIRTLCWLATVVLTGCQTMTGGYLPVSEFEEFSPDMNDKRVQATMKIRWDVREDASAYCAARMGMKQSGALNQPQPIACAVWNVANKECTVVTGTRTTHLALGHEVRHCFEGHFH